MIDHKANWPKWIIQVNPDKMHTCQYKFAVNQGPTTYVDLSQL